MADKNNVEDTLLWDIRTRVIEIEAELKTSLGGYKECLSRFGGRLDDQDRKDEKLDVRIRALEERSITFKATAKSMWIGVSIVGVVILAFISEVFKKYV